MLTGFYKIMRKNKKGFTLIELIVVVAILAILAIVAIPRFAGISEDAEDSAMLATATSILNAAEVFYVDNDNVSPADIAALSPDYLRDGDYTDYTLVDDGDGTFHVTYTDNVGAQSVGD